jgi:hypothetical protein
VKSRYEEVVQISKTRPGGCSTLPGAPWDKRCLNFHQQERAVRTPSRWQVRQPIYTGSVGRWKRFALYLQELKSAFAQFEDAE